MCLVGKLHKKRKALFAAVRDRIILDSIYPVALEAPLSTQQIAIMEDGRFRGGSKPGAREVFLPW